MGRAGSGAPGGAGAGDLDRDSIAGVPRNVFVLSVVSFLADISSEMTYPLVPIFLTTVVGAPVAAVGLIEGAAESTASLLRLVSGWFSDHFRRRLPLIYGGYGLATLGKLLLAAATVWPMVLLARLVDRFGKGMRGSPRDALIADSTPEERRGRAFGFHRSLDTAGAVVGPLAGLLLVYLLRDRLRLVFIMAAIPGALSVAALTFVREPRQGPFHGGGARPGWPSLRGFDTRLRLFLLGTAVFAFCNSSDVFLILRAKDLGLSTVAAVLAYVVYNLVYMAASLPAGELSDRWGRTYLFVFGLAVFALVYGGFAAATHAWMAWPLFAVYGVYIALTDGIGKAIVADLAPVGRRATALGAHGMVTGIGALVASVVAGLLWDGVDPAAPFVMGMVGALAAGAMLLGTIPRRTAGVVA